MAKHWLERAVDWCYLAAEADLTETELTAPAYGHEVVQPGDSDLTTQHEEIAPELLFGENLHRPGHCRLAGARSIKGRDEEECVAQKDRRQADNKEVDRS